MILAKGSIIKYEPTLRGRQRAVALIAQFPESCQTVARQPHHVELLTDFAVHPVTDEEEQRQRHAAHGARHHHAD